jgi:hypothetical protein
LITKKRTATDLGNPLNFSNSSSITALTLGTDLTITGAVYDGSAGSFIFKYNYNCSSFSVLTSQVIDPTYKNVSEVGNDLFFTYVKCDNGTNAKLYSIKNSNNVITQLTLSINNTPITSNSFVLDSYAGDYVYAKAVLGTTTTDFQLNTDQQTSVTVNELSPSTERINVKQLWPNLYKSSSNVVTSFSVYTEKLSYAGNGISGDVNLSNCVQSYSAPTRVFAPYVNAQTSNKELFIHGYNSVNQAASLNYNNSTINFLGYDNNSWSTDAAIADFDNTKVLMGSYPSGLIQTYNSSYSWNQPNNPVISYNTYYPSPNPANRLLAINQLKKMNNLHLLIGASTNGAGRAGATADETAVTIIDPSTNTINNIYHSLFTDYVFIHRAMDIDQQNNLICISGLKQTNPYASSSHLMVLNSSGNLQFHYDLLDNNGNNIYNVYNLVVDNETIYFTSGNFLYKINNYRSGTTQNPPHATQICFLSYLGVYSALELSPDNSNLVVSYLATGNDPSGYIGTKILIIPISESNLSFYPRNIGNIIEVGGLIPNEDYARPYEFAFSDNYCFLSGFTTVYGFTSSSFSGQSERVNFSGVKNNSTDVIKEKNVSVSPNPTSSNINVLFSTNENETISIQIYDGKGLLLVTKNVNAMAGKNKFELNTSSFNNGTYVLKVINKSNTITTKFIKL